MHGRLLGRGYATLNAFKAEHRVHVTVDNGAQTLCVSGTAADVAGALDALGRTCARKTRQGAPEAGAAVSHDSRACERIIDAHEQSRLALVIGVKGTTVRAMEADTGARVDKLQETLQGRGRGNAAAVQAACDKILAVLSAATHGTRRGGDGAPNRR